MLEILKWLYAINGFVAVLFFVPQITKAWKSRSAMESMSLVTLGGWSVSGAIAVLYAWFFAHDLMFAAASFGATMGNVAMFGIVTAKRVAYRRMPHEATLEEQFPEDRDNESGRALNNWLRPARSLRPPRRPPAFPSQPSCRRGSCAAGTAGNRAAIKHPF